jgi:DNA (cytosine-5)-methyltransferase 1
MYTFSRNLGLNKGKRRLFLEGAVLSENGINHGHRWNIISNGDNHIIVNIDPNGKRKIAGSPARPIIDMAGKTITDAFADSIERVSIERIAGGIIITGIK